MIRVNRILAHPSFRALLAEIDAAEAQRPFCGHGAEHLLAVARIMALTNGERPQPLPVSLLYAAALVHDLGRAEEYQGGRSHQEAAAPLARPILTDCGYSPAEIQLILTAVQQHRSSWPGARSPLGQLLFQADKESRLCTLCPVYTQCNWPEEKKNHTLFR